MKKGLVLSTIIALLSGLSAQAAIVYTNDFSTATLTVESTNPTLLGGATPEIAVEEWFSSASGEVDIQNGQIELHTDIAKTRGVAIWLDSSGWSNGTVTVKFDVSGWTAGGSTAEASFQAYAANGVNATDDVSIDLHGAFLAGPVIASTGSATINTIGAKNVITTDATQASYTFSFSGQENIALVWNNMADTDDALAAFNVDNLLVTSESGTVPAEFVTPAELAMSHAIGVGSTTGTVNAVFVSETNMNVTITISDQSDANAFTVLSATPQTLTNETTELAFKFDNTVANLVAGETATGLVTFAWTEAGGGASGMNFMAISATVAYPASSVYIWNGSSDGSWETDANWEGEFGQAVDPVFDNTAVIQIAGTANLDQIVRTHRTVKSLTFTSSNTAATQIGLVAGNGTADRDLIFEADSGNATLTVDALASGDKTLGTSGGAVTPGEVVLTSDLDITHNGSGDLLFAAEIRGAGDLSIAGTGATVLAGLKTFTIGGDGTNNVITGSGTASFDGSFSFNLTTAGTTLGDSWAIVDVDNLDETFGAGFTVDSFTDAGSDTWTNGIAGTVYQFSEISGLLTVLSISSDYETWIEGFGLSDDDLLPGTDVEPDGLNNLMEYALGGNPTIDDAAEVSPKTYTEGDGEMDYFYHVYDQRVDDASLTFTLGATDNLVSTPADTNEVEFVDQSAQSGSFRIQTNRTEASSSAKFIQLDVQKN